MKGCVSDRKILPLKKALKNQTGKQARYQLKRIMGFVCNFASSKGTHLGRISLLINRPSNVVVGGSEKRFAAAISTLVGAAEWCFNIKCTSRLKATSPR